jgi:hypothetical protein
MQTYVCYAQTMRLLIQEHTLTWCLLPMPFGTSHNGCMLHAWAMLRVLPSKAGCVRNMLWAGYALGMVVAWRRPTDCKSSHAPFSRH